MPGEIQTGGRRFEHIETFKHDFFAATGLYRCESELVVLKMGRETDFFGLPMKWIGTLLCRREKAHYRRVHEFSGVPRYVGRVGDTGFVHEFVPGHPLGRSESVSDTFFEELAVLLRRLHAAHLAYVDLNKRQNILMGDDGHPYLIDFQISLYLPPMGWRRLPPIRWLLARFQHADWYHTLKHKRRLRPDLLTAAEREQVERLSIWIRFQRAYAGPLTHLRRAILRRLHKTEHASVAGSSAK